MIADLGHSLLLTAFVISTIGIFIPLYLMKHSTTLSLKFSQINSAFLLSLLLASFMVLGYAFFVSDFSLKVVTLNSEVSEPLMYRLVALWGNHEGSLLLWVTTLSLYSFSFSFSGRGIATQKDRTRMMSVLSFLLSAFLLFMLMTSNPFESLAVTPHKGLGLNPILQDPSMTFHPPSLYFGYIGFVIPFAIAIGFLWRGHFKKEHAQWLRFWTLLPWSLLTFGVAAGSFWAYYELGWGGWWSWDPVENASLLPWIMATALLHAIGAYRRSGALKFWCLFLAVLTWLMSMLGTYITRSGIVASVHGFAKDEQRGLYLLIFMGILALISFLFLGGRVGKMRSRTSPVYTARSGFILMKISVFFFAAIILIIGTLYPIWGEATLTEAFFNTLLSPLALGLLAAMALVTFLTWRPQGVWSGLRKKLFPFNLGLFFIACLLYQEALPKTPENLVAIFILGLSIWVVASSIQAWFSKGAHAMMLAHIGFALSLMGMSVDVLFKEEGLFWMEPGKPQKFAGYYFVLDHISQTHTPSYDVETAVVSIFNAKGDYVGALTPQTRLYKTQQALVSKTSIVQRYWAHLYGVLGPELETGVRSLRLLYHPFVSLIWLGGGIMSLAGLIAMGGAFLRRKRQRRQCPYSTLPLH